jgi:gluconolactonase
LRSPNDIVLDARGGFYFTDPGGQDDPIGRVCYVDARGQPRIAAQWEGFPNGITLSPDGNVLYVAAFSRNEIIRFPVTAPGEVGPESLFAPLPQPEGVSLFGPDGIMFSPEGNLYVAHFGVGTIHVLNARGELVRSLPAGEKNAWSSNVAFGGPDRRTLYITGNPGPNPREKGFFTSSIYRPCARCAIGVKGRRHSQIVADARKAALSRIGRARAGIAVTVGRMCPGVSERRKE